MAKLTIEDLLAKKDRQEVKSKTVYLNGLGGELEVRRIPLARYMEYTDKASSGDAQAMLEAQCEMIYACCPILHDQQLQEAYECREPLEIVEKVLQDNLADMNALTVAIASLYGMDLEDDLKN